MARLIEKLAKISLFLLACGALAACGGTDPNGGSSGAAAGQAGKADRGGEDDGDARPASRVELKLMVAPEQQAQAVAALDLDWDDAEKRKITFYDDDARTLSRAGVILRSREVKGDDDDSTVKLRPFTREQIAPKWFDEDGFKCEVDRSVARGSTDKVSCSLTVVQGEDEIDDVADGKRSVKKLFSKEQEKLIDRYGGVDPWDLDLRVIGPVSVRRLRFRPDALGGDVRVTVERWRLPDGSTLLEISTKTDAGSAGALGAALRAWVVAAGVDPDRESSSKTRAVLAAFAATR